MFILSPLRQKFQYAFNTHTIINEKYANDLGLFNKVRQIFKKYELTDRRDVKMVKSMTRIH